MQLFLVSLALSYIIALYFMTNKMNHSKKFMMARFMNWFPLGMTYAFMYMGRYNLNVAKNALGDLMTKEDFGIIGGVGFTVYAISLFFVGPFIDKIGGKKGIILGSIGSIVMNSVLGAVLYLFVEGKVDFKLVPVFSLIYGMNMFFQSFGAVSTIKVKSSWFHVRERGTFGAIFGTLISLGVYFAFDWGAAIANSIKLEQAANPGAIYQLINFIFGLEGRTTPAYWLIFYIPAILLSIWVIIDWFILKDTPEEAGFPKLETHDASSGDKENYSYKELMVKIFTNKIIWTIGIIEFTSGILRNGILQWYKPFAIDTGLGVSHITSNWGFWGAITGIAGGFTAGLVSDYFFNSRRAPSAGIMQGIMFVAILLMAIFLKSNTLIVGVSAVLVMMAVIGVHSIMSGTATADFGGKKAAATATGVADAFAYAGSAVQSFALGYLTTKDWSYWPVFLLPFTLVGLYFSIRIWRDVPEATKKYLESVEKVKV